MPFAATWMDLQIIILSEIRQRISYDITYMWTLKKVIQMSLLTNNLTDLENKFMVTKGKRWAEG